MFSIQKNIKAIALICITSFFSFYTNANVNSSSRFQTALSLENAIAIAQYNDPWLLENKYEQHSLELSSTAANTLPDPKVSIDFINNPTDGFDFNQEGMTQTKVGLTQAFPRGKSLAIKSQQLKVHSEAFPFQRKNRQAKVAVTVGKIWLDLYQTNKTITLIERHQVLFEQLITISEKSYSSALVHSRQQDIVAAQIELTQLEERLDKLMQYKQYYEGKLFQWLAKLPITKNNINELSVNSYQLNRMVISDTLPDIPLFNEVLINKTSEIVPEQLIHEFANHPAIIAIDKKVNATTLGVELAKQKYKPEWEIKASYGHRRDDVLGQSRADLFSVGITFDVPLFTENKQDKEVQSAIAHSESTKVGKYLLLKEFIGVYTSAQGSLKRLQSRKQRFEQQLLPLLREQAQILLTAYSNESTHFSDVVKAHIAVLHAEIDELIIQTDEQKLHLELNYLFVDSNTPNPIFISNSIVKHQPLSIISGAAL